MVTNKYIILIFLITLIACIPETRNLAPTGDTAEIKTKDNQLYTGELLMVDESAIIMQIKSGQNDKNEGIYKFPRNKIQYIKIEDYVNTKWQGAILGFEVVPIVLLFIAAAAADVESPAGIAILFIPVLINYAIFAASTPAPPGVQDPFPTEQLVELKKYSRFPQGLNEELLNSFLSINNQDKIEVIE